MMDDLPRLDTEHVSAYFDPQMGISFITYRGHLTAEVTETLYAWVRSLLPHIGPDATRGVIFDFRQVTRFHQGNLEASRKQSVTINQEADNSTHCVALIVDNFYQEQLVSVSMNLTPGEKRKRIVRSMDEALAYIETWHAGRTL